MLEFFPVRYAVGPDADTGYANFHRALPNTRQQLLPPKPKELLITVCGLLARFSMRILSIVSGSGSCVWRVPGTSPVSSASIEMTASVIPAAPSV